MGNSMQEQTMRNNEKMDTDSKMVAMESHVHVTFIRTGYSGGNLIT